MHFTHLVGGLKEFGFACHPLFASQQKADIPEGAAQKPEDGFYHLASVMVARTALSIAVSWSSVA